MRHPMMRDSAGCFGTLHDANATGAEAQGEEADHRSWCLSVLVVSCPFDFCPLPFALLLIRCFWFLEDLAPCRRRPSRRVKPTSRNAPRISVAAALTRQQSGC
jgi:hypothetical protein